MSSFRPIAAIEVAVADGFANVVSLDGRATFEVGYCTGNLYDAVVGTRVRGTGPFDPLWNDGASCGSHFDECKSSEKIISFQIKYVKCGTAFFVKY